MNLSSGRGSHGLSDSPFGHVDHEALHLHQIFFPRRHSTRLLLSTCLCPPPPTPRPARFPPPSPRRSRAPPLPPTPPPRCARPRARPISRASEVGLLLPPVPTPHAWLLCLSLPLAACRPRPDPALSGTPWPRAAPAGCLLKCAKNRGRRPLAALLLGTSIASRVSWNLYGSVSSRC